LVAAFYDDGPTKKPALEAGLSVAMLIVGQGLKN